MRTFFLVITIIAVTALGVFFVRDKAPEGQPRVGEEVATTTAKTNGEARELPARAVIAQGLTIPWDIAFLPEGGMLVAERPGTIRFLSNGESEFKEIVIPSVHHTGEGGLLGITLHPDFEENKFVYAYHTVDTGGGKLVNQVMRYTFDGEAFSNATEIIGDIPGAPYHDGGRMAFGPDGLLYITTGDATDAESAQDTHSLAGNILRVKDDGSIPADNPFGNAVYSYGHRNPQGITWDEDGRLWSTEHGRSGIRSGLDEVNLIMAGGNYGWPDSEGDTVLSGTVAPAAHSGASTTWAPASALYWDGSIFFGGLRGEALYEAVLDGERVVEVREHFKNEFGRIRTVVLGPDGGMYITTSNRDGRGDPRAGDDKIIRLNPSQFR